MTVSQDGLTDQDMETGAQEWLSIMATIATAGFLRFFFQSFYDLTK